MGFSVHPLAINAGDISAELGTQAAQGEISTFLFCTVRRTLDFQSVTPFIIAMAVMTIFTGFSQAATTLYSSDFSATSGANSITGWTYGGDVGGSVFRSTTAFDNFDLGSGVYGGDGVKGDGSIVFNTGDGVAGNEYWTYTLSGTATEGDIYNLLGAAFNGNSSHNSTFTIGLYNVTDDRVLVTSANLGGSRTGLVDENINPFFNFDLNYTVGTEDVGDVFQIRVIENLNNTARDPFFDNIAVTVASAPEPSRLVLCMIALLAGFFHRRRSC